MMRGTRIVLWVVLGVTLAGVGAAALRDGLWRAEPLPVYGAVPDFALMDQTAAPLARADLAGAPWVADFIFTSCGGTCPAMSARMGALQALLKAEGLDEVRLVSFTVDPANDTPAVLKGYAARHDAGPRWSFVTGDKAALYRLATEGFRLSVAEASPEDIAAADQPLTHSSRFALVDPAGNLRGYFDGTAAETPAAVVAALHRLRAEFR